MVDLVEECRSMDGVSLRVGATLGLSECGFEYVREDVEGLYTEEAWDKAYQSLVGNQVTADEFAKVGDFGRLEYQKFVFEDVLILLVPASRYEAVFLSFDRTDDFPTEDVAAAAEAFLSSVEVDAESE